MLVEVQREWKEHSEGDIIDVNEAVAKELHSSGVAKILQSQGEKESALTTLQFKNAELSRAKVMAQYHESELTKLKKKIELLESTIKELQGDENNGTKQVIKAPKDKMLRKPIIRK